MAPADLLLAGLPETFDLYETAIPAGRNKAGRNETRYACPATITTQTIPPRGSPAKALTPPLAVPQR